MVDRDHSEDATNAPHFDPAELTRMVTELLMTGETTVNGRRYLLPYVPKEDDE